MDLDFEPGDRFDLFYPSSDYSNDLDEHFVGLIHKITPTRYSYEITAMDVLSLLSMNTCKLSSLRKSNYENFIMSIFEQSDYFGNDLAPIQFGNIEVFVDSALLPPSIDSMTITESMTLLQVLESVFKSFDGIGFIQLSVVGTNVTISIKDAPVFERKMQPEEFEDPVYDKSIEDRFSRVTVRNGEIAARYPYSTKSVRFNREKVITVDSGISTSDMQTIAKRYYNTYHSDYTPKQIKLVCCPSFDYKYKIGNLYHVIIDDELYKVILYSADYKYDGSMSVTCVFNRKPRKLIGFNISNY